MRRLSDSERVYLLDSEVLCADLKVARCTREVATQVGTPLSLSLVVLRRVDVELAAGNRGQHFGALILILVVEASTG